MRAEYAGLLGERAFGSAEAMGGVRAQEGMGGAVAADGRVALGGPRWEELLGAGAGEDGMGGMWEQG